MAYEDWMPEFQDVWDNLAGEYPAGTSQEEMAWAEYTFEVGFMTYAGELPPHEIEYAREEFFAVAGISRDEFDWAGWREAMGYE